MPGPIATSVLLCPNRSANSGSKPSLAFLMALAR